MSSLTLRKKTLTVQLSRLPRINLTGIVPDRLLELSLPEIAALPITVGDESVALENAFEIVEGHRNKLQLSGDLSHCDCVGGTMRGGELEVAGSVGNYLAQDMTSGRITVAGHAGSYACSSLGGGIVEIHGEVGEYAAAAAPGHHRGMNGGTLVVHGNAAPWLASRMRRGLVVVRGNVAQGCASRMIAGTVVIQGTVDLPLAYGLTRGTLLLVGEQASQLAGHIAGFTPPAACELSFLTILLREVAPHVSADCASLLLTSRWLRCLGDRAERGSGEVLLREINQTRHAQRVSHA